MPEPPKGDGIVCTSDGVHVYHGQREKRHFITKRHKRFNTQVQLLFEVFADDSFHTHSHMPPGFQKQSSLRVT